MAVKKLLSRQVSKMNSIFSPYIKGMMNNCSEYALNRGHIYTDSEGNVICDLTVTTEDGNDKLERYIYSMSENEVYTSANMKFKSNDVVARLTYNLLMTLLDVKYPIASVEFDFASFRFGLIAESRENPGEYKLRLSNPTFAEMLGFGSLTKNYENIKGMCTGEEI